jgi:hypothetical protein
MSEKHEWKVGDVVEPGGWKLMGKRWSNANKHIIWDVVQRDGREGIIWQYDLDNGIYKLRTSAEPSTAQPVANPCDSKIKAASAKSEPFRRALTAVWEVSRYGEGKHSPNNWQQAEPAGMHYYEDALWRHWMLRRMGYVHDGDELPVGRRGEGSRLNHLAHMAWSALMLLEMELRGVVPDEWAEPQQREDK